MGFEEQQRRIGCLRGRTTPINAGAGARVMLKSEAISSHSHKSHALALAIYFGLPLAGGCAKFGAKASSPQEQRAEQRPPTTSRT